MSDVSKIVDDIVGWIRGGKRPKNLAADADKLLTDVEAVGAGLEEAGPYGPAIAVDCGRVGAELVAIAGTRGLDIPAYEQAAGEIAQLASALQSAEKAFLDGWSRFKQTAGSASAAPPAIASKP